MQYLVNYLLWIAFAVAPINPPGVPLSNPDIVFDIETGEFSVPGAGVSYWYIEADTSAMASQNYHNGSLENYCSKSMGGGGYDACVMSSMHFSEEEWIIECPSLVILPRWEGMSDCGEDCVARWEPFFVSIATHEYGHVAIVREACRMARLSLMDSWDPEYVRNQTDIWRTAAIVANIEYDEIVYGSGYNYHVTMRPYKYM